MAHWPMQKCTIKQRDHAYSCICGMMHVKGKGVPQLVLSLSKKCAADGAQHTLPLNSLSLHKRDKHIGIVCLCQGTQTNRQNTTVLVYFFIYNIYRLREREKRYKVNTSLHKEEEWTLIFSNVYNHCIIFYHIQCRGVTHA